MKTTQVKDVYVEMEHRELAEMIATKAGVTLVADCWSLKEIREKNTGIRKYVLNVWDKSKPEQIQKT